MNRLNSLFVLSLVVLTFSGCLDSKARKDKFIEDMIKGGRSVKSKVMSESKGIMKDMKVYRDGDKDGVVFEYIYSKGVEVDASQLSDAKIKGTMLPQLRGDKNAKYAMDMGIYVKILYKSADGKVYGETTISKDDL